MERSTGACVWLTGLSGAGKSTVAGELVRALEHRGRVVTVLDGDVVRTHLSAGLGFTREDRDTNVRRIAFVASEVVRHGGLVICAVVSPYRAARDEARAMVGADRFLEVYVATPLEVCEARDPKGLYAQARSGKVAAMTGIDDPYEPPLRPDLVLETVDTTAAENAARIVAALAARGIGSDPGTPGYGASDVIADEAGPGAQDPGPGALSPVGVARDGAGG
jgi:sulfate adenylyltransferase